MKSVKHQYCRYCVEAVAHSEDHAYCGAISDWVHRTSRIDKCEHFSFCEIDAFAGFRGLDFDDPKAQYRAIEQRKQKANDGEQIGFEL